MIEWPATLPLPYVDYSGTPRNATIASPLSRGYLRRRQRFVKSYVDLQVAWVWTSAQLTAFQTFFDATLGNGAAQFSIELRYPRNTTLEEWIARFPAGYEPAYLDGRWAVTAPLHLVRRATLAATSEPMSWSPFLVYPEESGQDNQQFVTADGEDFYVRSP